MIYPEKSDFKKLSTEYDIVPVYKEFLADMETPVSVLKRFSQKRNVFLLESMEGGEKWGRYSFVGVDPEMLLEVDHSAGRTGTLEQIRSVYKDLKVAQLAGLPRFFGGAVGYIGYEAMAEFEKMPAPKKKNKERCRSRFLKADKLIVFDNVRHTIKIVICTRPSAAKDAGALYDEAVAQIDAIAGEMHQPVSSVSPACKDKIEFESNMTRPDFIKMIENAKKYIYDGDIIQVVLSQKFSCKADVDSVELYRALRLLNPSPYTFYIKIGDEALVGSSPEVMVRLTGNKVELRPIAGTRRRGATEQEDAALADELLVDEKEKAEHVMLVDLGRNDIGRIAESGSVQVTDYMVIERYSHVMHMVSHVQGILKKEYDAYDVIKATFPAGTLSGAPKIRAMQIIHELEPDPRAVYGGAVG